MIDMDELDKKIMSLLSIAKKAGFVKSGDFSAGTCLTSGKARLIIMAKNASINTKQKFGNKTFYYDVPYIVYGSKEKLSWAIGKNDCAVIAISDEGLASKLHEMILNLLEAEGLDTH